MREIDENSETQEIPKTEISTAKINDAEQIKLLSFYREKLKRVREKNISKKDRLSGKPNLTRNVKPPKIPEVNNHKKEYCPAVMGRLGIERQCFYCCKPVTESCLCQHCSRVYVCSPVHAELHRYDNYCFPFIVKQSTELGRYCVASRDIEPCELVLREESSAAGPYTKTPPVCLQCFKRVDGSYTCTRCMAPMCDEICASGLLHKQECDYFSENDIQFCIKRFDKPNSSYVSITLLRMLLKKTRDPDVFNRIDFLMDHVEERTSNESIATAMYKNVTQFLRQTCKMTDFSEIEISRLIGILRTNGMKLEQVGSRECPGVSLYPVYCLLNHACYNNTNYVKYPDLHLELRAQSKILAGEEITTRYISSTLGTFRRRRDILKYWFFNCNCSRCVDVTEMGTNMSALRCNKCSDGLLLPIDVMDYDSIWKCNTCQNSWTVEHVTKILEKYDDDIQQLLGEDVLTLEESIYKYTKDTELHMNHYLVVELCHSLIHKYTALAVITKLSRPEHERRVQLCLHVLDILTKVDPGFTKWRGVVLQEMVSSMMIMAKSDWKNGVIEEQLFKKRLYFCMVTLSQARKCQKGGFSKGLVF